MLEKQNQQLPFYHKDKKIKEPVGEHFNLRGHEWKDMTVVVIGHIRLLNILFEKLELCVIKKVIQKFLNILSRLSGKFHF